MIRRTSIAASVFISCMSVSFVFTSSYAATPISYGNSTVGEINPAGEIDEYTFNGTSGDVTTLRFSKTDGNLTVKAELFNPSQVSMGNSTTGVLDKTLNTTGTHKIKIYDSAGNKTGNYSIGLQRVNGPWGSSTLSFGQSTGGTINPYAKIDTYNITASANDMVVAAAAMVTQSAGTFDPYLELYNSTGTKLTAASGRLEQKVSSNGTYFLLVTDFSRNGAGTYDLTLQRANNPVNTTAIGLGNYSENVIGPYSDVDPYSVSLNVNDTVTVRTGVISTTTGSFNPYLNLYNSTGSLITSYPGSLTQKVTANGTYYIFVTDNGRNGNGTYSIGVQRVNNPAGASALSFGQMTNSTINSYAQIKSYGFSANANDTITLRAAKMTQYAGLFDPYMELYNATAALISQAAGSITSKVTTSGNFTVLVTDQSTNGAGAYSLGIQRVNNPGNATALAFGQTVSGVINTPAKMDTYTFSALTGDQLLISNAKLSDSGPGTFNPYLELYNSTGALVTYAYADRLQIAVANGTYCLIVTDQARDGTGLYENTLQRTNNPANVVDMIYNVTSNSSIASPSRFNVYRMTANAGDNKTFCSVPEETTSGVFDMYTEIYNSTGIRKAYGYVSGLSYTFPSTGTYYLFMSDYTSNGAGSYKWKSVNATVSCAFIDLVDPIINLTSPQPGVVIESGSSYNINWTADATVWQEIRLSTDSGATYPTVIVTNLTLGQTATYGWNVPGNLTSTQARIKIIARDAGGNEGFDANQGNFVIMNTTGPANTVNLTYQYNEKNQLIHSSINGTANATYFYDALGNRLTRSTN